MAYRVHGRKRRVPKRIMFITGLVVVALLVSVVVVRNIYSNGLKAVNDDQATQLFTVEPGASVKVIAQNLEDKRLIRSAWSMQLYIHSKELGDKLQAGTYAFSPNQGTERIVKTLTKGTVSTKLVTILPGRRIDQVRADLINDGFAPTDVDAALDPSQYAGMPILAFKPATATNLEGLLWPDSYQKDASTSASTIIREALETMGEKLTPDVQAAFAAEGLTTYQGLILTSIVTQEVSKPADQAQVAQVFLSRLKTDMQLGSDVTALYGSVVANKGSNLSYDSPYNTLQHKGLPPGPISTVSGNALTAATHPAATDWLYFVAGDDGTTYFSHTFDEHEDAAAKYCHKLCNQ